MPGQLVRARRAGLCRAGPCRTTPARRFRSATLQLVREGGLGALFAGLEASLIGTTVSQGIYFYL